jgi:hypothetical protein
LYDMGEEDREDFDDEEDEIWRTSEQCTRRIQNIYLYW